MGWPTCSAASPPSASTPNYEMTPRNSRTTFSSTLGMPHCMSDRPRSPESATSPEHPTNCTNPGAEAMTPTASGQPPEPPRYPGEV